MGKADTYFAIDDTGKVSELPVEGSGKSMAAKGAAKGGADGMQGGAQGGFTAAVAEAQTALNNGDLALAEGLFRTLAQTQPDKPQGWKGLVDVYEASKNRAGLVEPLTKTIEIAEVKGNFQRSRPLRVRLAEVLEGQGQIEKAIGVLDSFDKNPAAKDQERMPKDVTVRLRMALMDMKWEKNAVAVQNGHKAPPATNGDGVGKRSTLTANAKPFALSPNNLPPPPAAAPVPQGPHRLATGQNVDQLRALAEPERLEAVSQLLGCLTECKSAAKREVASKDVAQVVKTVGVASPEMPWLLAGLGQALEDGDSPIAREGALLGIEQLCETVGPSLEPALVPFLPSLIDRHADGALNIRDNAASAGRAVISLVNQNAVRMLLRDLFRGMDHKDWRAKVGALNLLGQLAIRAPQQIGKSLPQIVPKVSECVWDTKREVQMASLDALTEACKCVGNPDILSLVPQLVSVVARPEETPGVLDALLGTTFVSTVDSPTLAIIAPLLIKCLRDRSSALKRKASRVIDNMCRLVADPSDVAPFTARLLPLLQKVIDEIADLEVAEVAREAHATIIRAVGEGDVAVEEMAQSSDVEAAGVEERVFRALQDTLHLQAPEAHVEDSVQRYVSALCAELILAKRGASEWRGCVVPYLSPYVPGGVEQASSLCETFRKAAHGGTAEEQAVDDDDQDICNIEFSLAFGGKILLYNARLRLSRGRRYGLVGKNGVGKTTLMRNIANGNIEGLPVELKTVYVQHEDVVGDDPDTPVIQALASTKGLDASPQEIRAVLKDVGFDEQKQMVPVSSLSGGWMMKAALARAMLSKPDVLLLDEPTNHLDAASVAWLTRWLQGLKHVTCLVVSHESRFLDDVVTDILHYEERKLVRYVGNLSTFVKKHPEAKHYYDLEAVDEENQFAFPNPGVLDGIRSTTRAILSMDDVTFAYPGNDEPTLRDVRIKLALGSRVAVVGANGAGKSTLIKLLVRALEPQTGKVWAHHNLRVAYVAQRSLHHVEQHLDQSPVAYIQWRFGGPGGIDREAEEKVNMKMNEDENKLVGRTYGQVEKLLGRRMRGKTLEYECKFVGMHEKHNRYLPVDELRGMGLDKLVTQMDEKIAAVAAGLDLRPVTTWEIQKHLDDFGLAAEFGTHGKIAGLSGGQKVKLVLAAAMWNRPHLLVLDEPTNYLDTSSLSALTNAIKNFGGGVIMISHNAHFCNALCNEQWFVEAGRVIVQGQAEESALKTSDRKTLRDAAAEAEPVASSAGCTNGTIEKGELMNPKTFKPLSKKEIRNLQKLAIKANISLSDYVKGITRASPEWKWL